jgi:DNA-binding response OmpR family regulator
MASAVVIFSTDIEFHLLSKYVLVAAGYQVTLINDMADLFAHVDSHEPAVIVIDCRRNDRRGIDICREIKTHPTPTTPAVIAVVEKGDDSILIEAIEAGADRAFRRPFDPAEVLDCLAGFAERSSSALQSHVTEYGALRVDALRRRAYYEDDLVPLGQIQFQLLRLLVESPGQTFRREELITAAWPEGTFVDDRTVDVHVGILRRALRKAGAADMIQTIRGTGYSLIDA